MAKKIPRIPVPKAKTKMSWLDKLFMGVGGASPFVNRIGNRGNVQSWGRGSWRARNAANVAKYGKWGLRGARMTGLLNPWTAVPFGLMSLAQYGVGKAFDPYRDETGRIGAEGHERLLQERLAREELMTARNIARGQENVTGMFSEGGIARLL